MPKTAITIALLPTATKLFGLTHVFQLHFTAEVSHMRERAIMGELFAILTERSGSIPNMRCRTEIEEFPIYQEASLTARSGTLTRRSSSNRATLLHCSIEGLPMGANRTMKGQRPTSQLPF